MKKIFKILWLPVVIYFFNISSIAEYLYATQSYFDVFMHLLGGFAIAYMFITMMNLYKISWWHQIPVLWKIIFVTGFVMLFGCAWEWYEFISDIFLKTHHQPGLEDTMYDILYDFIGGLAFCVLKISSFSKRT